MKKALKYINDAYKNKYAIPQFNINNLEWAKYILEACEEEKSPVILGASPSAIEYMGGYLTVRMLVNGLIKDLNISVPVILHLDHGKDYHNAIDAIKAHFDSVMIDYSAKDFNENTGVTNMIYKKAGGILAEAEIGQILNNENINITDLDTVVRFNKKAKFDMLAPAIGNFHGIKNILPKLDFSLLESINQKLNKPLVLHGGTGLSSEDLKKCIAGGVAKINFNTELQEAWAKALRTYILENPEVIDPRKIISSGKEAIKRVVKEKIAILNRANRG